MPVPEDIPPHLESSLRAGYLLSHPEPGEEIVISGLSGSFPESRNIYEFRDNLFNKVDMITSDTRRWDVEHPEIPKYSGKIPDIEFFDAAFFGLHHKQAKIMDSSGRMSLEKSFEAVLDAGISLEEIRGTKTGVFIGNSICEHHLRWFYMEPNKEALFGCNKSMFAQRVSYWLGIDGPSYIVDTACSSSHYALDHGYRAIREGLCDNAIVLGCNTVLHPIISVQFNRLGVLNKDGKCKCFDDRADGYTRSEAICAVLLQKAKNAKRIYAQIVHSKANCDGYKEEGITYPSGQMQEVLLKEFYQECEYDPRKIDFVEAHGTGTKVGDPEELKALDNIFCKGRNEPLLIGSVKSNIGHSEPASGLCSVTKVLIAMETGYIPPNINFKLLKKDLIQIKEGRMKVVTDKTKWNVGYAGVNCFGFGGANCHVLLRANEKTKVNFGIPEDDLPRLIYFSGRTEEALQAVINDVNSRPLDAEFVRIIQEAFKYNIDGHYHRGFAVLSKMQNMVYKTVTYDGVPRPIWLMFSGLGSQWAGMGTSMMKLPAFSSTIQKCQKILSSKGIDVAKVITDPDLKIFEDNVNITVGITAIQLALVDLLKILQISPTRYIGYSIGEVACAYADEALTLEEAILCSYFIGLASKDMHTEAQLVRNLKKVIATSKIRSPKWMTTTENTELARYCSAEYLVHSLSCSVTLKQNIPKDAVVIEIAPHGHLQNLLKKAFSEDVVTLSLMQREQDNLQVFFSAVGKLYLSGCNPRVEFLYPEIQFPVSRGTPMISPLIKWKYEKKWHVPRYEEDVKEYDVVSTRIFTITVREENKFLTGHTIDGRILYPATGYLTLAWRTLAMFHNIGYQQVSVIFENVKFLRATHLAMEGRVYLMAILQPASGNFEITENDQTVATGRIRLVNEKDLQTEMSNMQAPYLERKDYYRTLTTKDIYKELRLRGYYYSGMFRGIHSCDVSGTVGELIWKDNYITFMDTMLQIQILQTDTRGLFIPTLIEKVVINTQKQQEIAEEIGEDGTIPIYSYKELNLTIAGGVEIQGVQVNAIARRKPLGEPVLETYKFVPNQTKNLTLEQSIRIITQLALENIPNIKVRTAEILDDSTNKDSELLSPLLQKDFGDLPLIQADINVLTTTQMEEISGITISDKNVATESNCLLVVGTNLIGRPQVMLTAFNALSEGGFVIARECLDFDVSTIEDNVQVILCHELEKEKILLLRRANKEKLQAVVDVSNAIDTLDWLPLLQSAVKNDPNTVVYSQGDELSGVLGLVNCIRKEPGTNNVRCVFIMDKDAPKFDLGDEFYAKQLQKGLGVNVLKNGIWGTYRHLLLPPQKNVEVEHAYVNVTVRGDLSSLRWIQGDLKADLKLKPNQLLVYTYYAALNFRDIMTATGRIAPEVLAKGRFNQECVQGLEYSGRLPNGQRVMGMINSRALSTMHIPDPDLLWIIPDHWTLEDAATVPVVYGTVIYAFIIHGKIESGKTILIHSGSGGIGQAAINVALYYGMKVYTTVGTPEKREFIKKTWPQIKDNQIGNSRDISFEQMIMVETNGRGVDYVLNSLAEEKLQASIRCLARGGKFLEIGKFDLANNNPLPLSLFEKDASFHGIMLDNMFDDSNDTKKALSIGLATCIRDGAVKPLTRTVFCDDEVEEAFRFMATGKHMGKVLIKIREEETEKIVEPKRRLISAVPRYLASPEGCYVITGGLGGFGLELADWLVLRGARNLVLTSRRGIMTGYQASRIRIWRTYGVRVKISTADITTFEGGKLLIKEAAEMGPVEGVFNLAVVLKDAILENQTVENFEQSFGPKAVAAKYLDGITRRMCPKLRLFVIFSSVSCGRGNAGQTNYGMANSIMERICEQRKMADYPALAIEWGAVGEVGLVAEMQENHGELEISGTLQQKISSCLSLLDQFFKQDDPIVSSIVVAEKKSTSGAGGNIIDAVANILGIHDIKTVSFHSSLAELGMDSIMAVEIKQTLEREFEVFLTPQDIRSLSFARLQNIASEKQEASSPQEVDVSEMGMKLMFRTVGDEKTSAESIIILPSLAPPESKNKVILIPGIEGMASVLEPLARNLEAQAVCLQLGFVNQDSEISEMANALLERTLFQLQDTDKFVMIGYSFGAAITLELAVMLELNGKIGKVILLDGSPSMLRGMANLQLVTDNEDTFQNAVLSIILNLYLAGGSIPALRMAFEKQPTWEEKVNAFLENVPKNITLSKAYQIAMCEAIYRRLKAISSYDPSLRKLKSNITLIKPLSPSYVHPDEDFGLSQFSESPVDVITVEGNHVTILDNKDSAEEINKIIKREFKE